MTENKTEITPEELSLYKALCEARPWEKAVYDDDDIGNSRMFADFLAPCVRFVDERKCWFVYDGQVWRADVNGLRVMEKCKLLARMFELSLYTVRDKFMREKYRERVWKWKKRTERERILKDAAGLMEARMADFDADPLLFNCPNGTLNLRDFTFHEHRPEDMITMMSGAEYHPEMECPRWETFIDEVMQSAVPPDHVQLKMFQEQAEGVSVTVQKKTYLQMALGYALTGLTKYECMFLLYGATTRNGKGTMMETILRMMGDYGKTAMPETIGTRPYQSSSAPREDVARLRGARFVNISEPDKRLTLSAALVKQMTGSDTITARFLHENSFEFRPQFKMFVNTNYLPQITDMTLFTSGRIKTIPFERHFEPHEQDRTLKEFFALPDSLSGILTWCVLGYHTLCELGFAEPPIIRAATERYRRDSDKIAQFVEEMLVEDASGEIKTADLYALYKHWCDENGYMSENMKNFKSEMGKKGRIVRKRSREAGSKSNPTMMFLGYRAA